MPASPYAKALYSVNGGANTSGGTVVAASATIQLVGESTVGWVNQLWEIYEYPTGFALPSGWTNVNGSYQSTAVTPPIFTLPGASTWGKFLFRLTVNHGLLAGVPAPAGSVQPLVDISSAVAILSAKGLRDTAFGETNQFDADRDWVGDMKVDWRTIDTLFQTGGGGVGQVSFTVDAGSAAIVAGNVVTMAPGAATVTLATAAAVTAAGGVLGVATSSGTAGQVISVSVESMVPNSVTGLGAGTQAFVRVNTTTHNCERVASFSIGDSPVGTCNTAGDVLMIRGAVVGLAPTGSAGGALGGTYPNPTIALGSNAGLTGQLDSSKVAGVLGSTAPGALTTGKVLRVTGASAVDYGAVDLTNSNAVTGRLPVANQAAPTTTGVLSVPTATTSGVPDAACVPINGANGVAGTDASSKVALANVHNAIIESKGVKDSTAWNTALDSFTTTSYVDSGTYKFTFASALAIGDIVEISFAGFVTATGTVDARFCVSVTDNGATTDEIIFLWDTASANNQPISGVARYVVTAANAINTFKVAVRGKRISGTGAAQLMSQGSLFSRVVRP